MSEGNIQTVSDQLKSKIQGMDLNFKSDDSPMDFDLNFRNIFCRLNKMAV